MKLAVRLALPLFLLPAVILPSFGMSETPALAKAYYLQEWDVWTSEGLVDFVVPMLYLKEDQMQRGTSAALASAQDRAVYVGVGAYRLSGEMTRKHIEDIRAAGAAGVVLYNYHCLRQDTDGKNPARLSDIVSTVFGEPASVPVMAWKDEKGGTD